jgi:hypothetical protein
VGAFIPASLFETIASRTSADIGANGESVDAGVYEKTLALVDVCVNRIGKGRSLELIAVIARLDRAIQ